MTPGLRIIVTRPEPDAAATALKLREMGHVPLVSPALNFIPLDNRLPDPGALSALVATSANALRALKVRGLLKQYRHLKLFTVGDATAETARAFGFEDITSAGGTATSLALLLKKVPRQRIFYASSRHRSVDLAPMLRSSGHLVVTAPVYDMQPSGELTTPVILALNGGAVDAALFYSRRSAAAFIDAAKPATRVWRDLPSLCLSVQIAELLHERGVRRVFAAPEPSEDALLGLIATFALG